MGRRHPHHFWTPDEDRTLREIYPDLTCAEVAERMGRTKCSVFQRARLLGLGKSQAFFQSDRSGRMQRGRTNPGMIATQFKPGQKPWNTGTKGLAGQHPNCKRHQFQKGSKSGRALRLEVPIGAERIVDGILQRKVNNDLPMQRRWRSVHSLVWEEANGLIPPRHKVIFRLGQHTTISELITLDRLELVSNAELMRRNSYHNRYPPELRRLIQLRGVLNRKINQKTEALREKSD